MELLDALIEYGWDGYVRRSLPTAARPAGKVLRWGVRTPDGVVLEARTGPALVAALTEHCRAAGTPLATGDHGIPVVPEPVVPEPEPEPEPQRDPGDGQPAPLGRRRYTGNLDRAGSRRKAVRYSPLDRFPEHAAALENLRRDALRLYTGAAKGGAPRVARAAMSPDELEALSWSISAQCAELHAAGVPLLTIGTVIGVTHSSVRNRIRAHHARQARL